MSNDKIISKINSKSTGTLFGLLVASFYILLTLLPNSNSLVVSWSWVFIWQIALICPIIWWLWLLWHQQEIELLGNVLDWIVVLTIISLTISTIFAEFPVHARWYSWAAFCFLITIYALNQWLQQSHFSEKRNLLLTGLGYLSLIFMIVSLSLWLNKTVFPELSRLQQLQQYGINLSFNFGDVNLRNRFPIGHQNYTAGYLLLVFPLFISLSFINKGWQRWFWLATTGLGLLTFYTTSSRGGWLGLAVLSFYGLGVLLLSSKISRLWLGLSSLGIFVVLLLLGISNNRLRSLITSLLRGEGGGELAYRLITNITGWRMGVSHPWSGVGLGNAPLLYQNYRPVWAGQEAEFNFQLHSTPAQLWAELGIWGIIIPIALFVLLIYLGIRWMRTITKNPLATAKNEQIFTWSIYGGLLAYGVMSITDYQLDNVAISGVIVIYLAILASEFRQTLPTNTQKEPIFLTQTKFVRGVVLAGVGVLAAVSFWLVPIHRAWQLSSQGFSALEQGNIPLFVQNLNRAHQLAPWEAYYPYQLGWTFGDMSLQATNPEQKQQLRQLSRDWLQRGIALSPYQDFGYTNLAWLLLADNEPSAAAAELTYSAQLWSSRKGIFYWLGLSLLEAGEEDLAIEAMTLEVLRHPIMITSPGWNSSQLQPIYTQVIERLESRYAELLEEYPQSEKLENYIYQSRGILRWWWGDLSGARNDLEAFGTELSNLVLDLAENQPVETQLANLSSSPTTLVVSAWLNPSQRQDLLTQAWIEAENEPPSPQVIERLASSMDEQDSFREWLQENRLSNQYRPTRVEFRLVSRHLDGQPPIDFWTFSENLAVNKFLSELFPAPKYLPELDLGLQEWRNQLLD